MNTTPVRVEVSRDGETWLPIYLRTAPAEVQAAPDPNLLPEGWRWCEVAEPGKAVRWVPVLAADGGE